MDNKQAKKSIDQIEWENNLNSKRRNKHYELHREEEQAKSLERYHENKLNDKKLRDENGEQPHNFSFLS